MQLCYQQSHMQVNLRQYKRHLNAPELKYIRKQMGKIKWNQEGNENIRQTIKQEDIIKKY